MRGAALVVLALLPACAVETSPGRCDAPDPADLVGAVSRVGADGRLAGSAPTGYLAEVGVRSGALVVTDEEGVQSRVAGAQGPRRVVPQGLRTFGTRLEGTDGATVRWTQEGAGGAGIGQAGDVAVVLGQDRQLRGVRVGDGALLWNSRLDAGLVVRDARLLGDRVVLVGQRPPPGEAYGPPVAAALDAATGRLLWTAGLTGADPDGLLLTALGGVVAAGAGERVTGLDLSSGRRLWSADLGVPGEQVLKALDVDAGAVVAVTTQETFGCE